MEHKPPRIAWIGKRPQSRRMSQRKQKFEKVISYTPKSNYRFSGFFMVAIASIFFMWTPDSEWIYGRTAWALCYTAWAVFAIVFFYVLDYYMKREVTWRRIR